MWDSGVSKQLLKKKSKKTKEKKVKTQKLDKYSVIFKKEMVASTTNVNIVSSVLSSVSWSPRFDYFLPRSHFGSISNTPFSSLSAANATTISFGLRPRQTRVLNRVAKPPAATMVPQNPVVSDICATALSVCIVLSLLRLWGETAKRGLFDQVKIKIPFCSSV